MPEKRIPFRLTSLLLIPLLVLLVVVILYTALNRTRPAPAAMSPVSPAAVEAETGAGGNDVSVSPISSSLLPDSNAEGVDEREQETAAALAETTFPGERLPEGAAENSWHLTGETPLADAPELPFDPAAVIEQSRNVFQVDASGRPFIQQPAHEAVLEEGQLQFTALAGEGSDFFNAGTGELMTGTAVAATPLRLNIALAHIRVGDQDVPLVSKPVYEADGNIIRAERGPRLVEEFVARDSGIEQRWRLDSAPTHNGDLALAVEATTALSLTVDDEGYVFSAPTREGASVPVIRYGRALAIDAGGAEQWAELSVSELPPAPDGRHRYRLQMTLPADWLATTQYPLLIDPLISNLIRLEQSAPTNNQSAPEVAYNPNQDEFLLVWQDYRNGNWDIYGQRVSGDGVLLDENFILLSANYQQSNPRLAYGDDIYLVVWRHYHSTTYYDVRGAVISGTGQIVTNTLAIATNISKLEHPTDVVFNSTSSRFLVLWQEKGSYWDVWGRHVAADGSMGSAFQITSQTSWNEENTAGAYNPADDEYLVVWRRNAGGSTQLVEARRLDGNGTLLGSVIDISNGSGQERDPDVIYLAGADRYVAIWRDNRNNSPSNYDIYAQLVQPDGTLDGSNFVVTGATVEETTPRLAVDAGTGGALVVWRHNTGGGAGYDLYGRLLDSNGEVAGSSFAVQAENGNQYSPVLAQNSNGDVLVAWYDDRHGNQDIFSRMRLASGSWGGAGMAHPAPGDQEKPQIAYNPDDDEYLVVWQDYRSSADWDIYGQRVAGDGALIGQNIAVDTTATKHQIRPIVAYGANEYLVAWQHYTDANNTTYDVYGRVISRSGSFVTGAFVIANSTDSKGKPILDVPNDVVYNNGSDQFLVLWQVEASTGNWDIAGRHVSPTGATGSVIAIAAAAGSEQDAASAYNPDDDQYLVVWDTHPGQFDTIYGRRLTGSGTVTTTDSIVISTQADTDSAADVVYLPATDQYYVVWTKGNYGFQNGDILGRAVYPGGSTGNIQTINATSQDERHPRLTPNDSGMLVAWQKLDANGHDLYGRLLNSYGQPIEGPVVVLEAGGSQRNPVLLYGGNDRYLVAWQDDREGGWDLYAGLFTPTRYWQLVSTVSLTPTVAGEYAMAFDSLRNVTILYGGNHTGWPYENNTWEFNGVDWSQITTTQKPDARYGTAIAYDSSDSATVLFGGSDADDVALAQTWTYNGANWTQQSPANAPPARSEHRLVYASGPQKIFLFGGRNGETYYNDVWHYDGSNWTQVTVSGQSPAARSLHALAYNPANNTLFLFGGRDASGVLLSDTWSFNVATSSWTQLTSGPSARQAHSLAYDPMQLRLVLVGGVTSSGDTLLDDTWTYQEGVWSNTNAVPSAPVGAKHALVYDGSDDALILFTNGQTWRFK